MWWSTFLLSLREIRRNLMRSFLTVLGIVIGVAAVITMVTLGNGATRAVSDQISSLGSNLLMIRPGQRLGPVGDSGQQLFKESDAQALAAQVPGIDAVAPAQGATVVAVFGGRNWSTRVTGTTNAYFQTNNWRLSAGRIFSELEERSGASVCLIGETVRSQLYLSQEAVGTQLRVRQFSCQVIGILASKGQAAMGQDQDDTVVMPLHAVQRRLTGSQYVATLLVSVAEDADGEQVKRGIAQVLRERRRLSDSDEDNFNIMDTRQIAEALSGTTRVMTTLLGAVAGVSLLVGGIGIMNIMLVSVTERTREIGVRLAIGALEREVLLQFMVEAVVLSSVGGLIGVVLAVLASTVLAAAMKVPLMFDPGIMMVAFAFSAVIGVVFGFFPARRAARLDPIDALRHE
jgi:putative ABC transport system permease protein